MRNADSPPDLVLADYTLSEGTGVVPFAVVMVSADASTEPATAALSAGAGEPAAPRRAPSYLA